MHIENPHTEDVIMGSQIFLNYVSAQVECNLSCALALCFQTLMNSLTRCAHVPHIHLSHARVHEQSCYTEVGEGKKTIYKELIMTPDGGTKKWTSKTNFAKMFINAFPLRAHIVYDDGNNVGVLYDEGIQKLVRVNEDPEIQDKVKLRKELRCLHDKDVTFPIERWETRKVNHTTQDENGNTKKETKEVLVLISYTKGAFEIAQTKGKDTRKTVGTKFDLSRGFEATLSYRDGTGSTTEYDGAEYRNQEVTIGHDALGMPL